jgi:NADPH2:quinone reductase
MRAIVLAENCAPDALRITDVPRPDPAAGQVRIRVAYCALNPLDTHARAGRIKWGVPALPFTLGYEYAGRVYAVGEGVDAAWIGRRVAVFGCWGGCADYAVAPVAELREVPDGLDWAMACCFFTCAFTSWHLVHTAGQVRPGQVVVVHSAAGAVGLMTTQILKEAGAVVIGLVSTSARAEWARRFGAEEPAVPGAVRPRDLHRRHRRAGAAGAGRPARRRLDRGAGLRGPARHGGHARQRGRRHPRGAGVRPLEAADQPAG